ncbi:pPE family protein [Mycobacterium xenopi 4042]|uniref:PPE family protein n=1 Tax=Mycobacterium xenopi 4042 TaxID=1299334 RepID=X7YR34_MYCXE|nr:pPE family protein [Mycobacterium xenopi 4042]
MWWVVRALELFEDFQQFGVDLVQNPAAAFQYLVELALFDWPTHIAQLTGLNPTQQLLAVVIGAALARPGPWVASRADRPGRHALCRARRGAAAEPASAPTVLPAVAMAPTMSVPAGPRPGPGTHDRLGGQHCRRFCSADTPLGDSECGGFRPSLRGGPPGIGAGTGMSTSASSSAKRKAPEPDSAAARAAAAAGQQARARRRRRATERGLATSSWPCTSTSTLTGSRRTSSRRLHGGLG